MKIERSNFVALRSNRERFAVAFLAICIALLATAPALAQEVSKAPRQPAATNLSSAWVGYAAMTLIFALILLISLRSSARGEQKS